jgi:hypothetical protein
MNRNQQEQAFIYFEKAAEAQSDLYQGFIQMAQVYMQRSMNGLDDQEKSNLEKAKYYFTLSRERLESHYRRNNNMQALQGNQHYRYITQMLQKVDAEIKTPRSVLNNLISRAQSGAPEDLKALADAYKARLEIPQAIEIYDRLIAASPQRVQPYLDKFEFCRQFYSYPAAVNVLELAIERSAAIEDLHPLQHLAFLELCGLFYHQAGRQLKKQNNITECLNYLSRATIYLQRFLQEAPAFQDRPEIRQKIGNVNKALYDIQLMNKALNPPEQVPSS